MTIENADFICCLWLQSHSDIFEIVGVFVAVLGLQELSWRSVQSIRFRLVPSLSNHDSNLHRQMLEAKRENKPMFVSKHAPRKPNERILSKVDLREQR